MTFNSIEFLIFFPLVTTLYFAIPARFRWILLLGASYYFYMCWRPDYIILVVISTLIDYYASRAMSKFPERARRRKYLLLSLASNLGLLFIFKYFNFFSCELEQLLAWLDISYALPALKVLLPIGISFYTFQTLSYTIDVYRGKIKAEQHLGIFALYVAFFPQLVSGPIERACHLLPQFKRQTVFEYGRVTDGLKLMVWGMFKKVVIADRLALVVDQVYGMPDHYSASSLALATVFFAFQIYCDFSGYTDIAIGAAQVLGFDLMQNFRRPYFAKSIADFWRRWHISLSTWFRDYVYIPLGGSQTSLARWVLAVVAVFLLSGLWHGANWTFLAWGGLHAAYYLGSKFWARPGADLARFLRLTECSWLLDGFKIITTFILVCFAWIFFRASSVQAALTIVGRLRQGWLESFHFDSNAVGYIGMPKHEFLLSLGLIGFLLAVQIAQHFGGIRKRLNRSPAYIRWPAYIAITLFMLNYGMVLRTPFVYYQF